MTRGEEIIRPDFAKNDEVKEMKLAFVGLFDLIMTKIHTSPEEETTQEEENKKAEINRLLVKALEHIEVSAMYAVKGLTV